LVAPIGGESIGGAMTGVGDTLRSARERRGESLAAAADATGLRIADLLRLERDPLDAAEAAGWAAPLVERYATHLGLDGALLADEVRSQLGDDPEADTRPVPAVAPRARRDSALIWLGAGAIAGVAGLALLGGGLGSGGAGTEAKPDAAAPVTAAAAGRPPATAPPVQTVRPTPSRRAAIELRLGARPGTTVWVAVRRGGASGKSIFAGLVGAGVTRGFTSTRPLWLRVGWAPNVRVAVNGEEVDAPGGTESYLVTARGLKRLARS